MAKINLEITSNTAELVAQAMWESGPDGLVEWDDIGHDCQQEFIDMAKAGIKKLEELHTKAATVAERKRG